jgi:hypothetical protein
MIDHGAAKQAVLPASGIVLPFGIDHGLVEAGEQAAKIGVLELSNELRI